MVSKRSLLLRLGGPAVLIAGLGAGAYAFTAANSMGTTGASAGAGSTTVSGYTVAAVKYNSDATDPRNIATVTFTLAPVSGTLDPTTVAVSLDGDNGSPTWMYATGAADCVFGTVTAHVTPVTCTPASTTTMASVTQLAIVATAN